MKYILALALIVLALTACAPSIIPVQEGPGVIDVPPSVPSEDNVGVGVFADEDIGNLPPMPE